MPSTLYTIDMGELGEQQFDITYTYTPGRPEQISGPPERCYEAEPSEFELIKLRRGDREVGWPLEEMVANFLYESDDFANHLDDVELERTNPC